MMKTISIQLPADLVEFMDEQKASGNVKSRNAAIATALRRERRRVRIEQDAAVYAARGEDPDLGMLAERAADTPLDID